MANFWLYNANIVILSLFKPRHVVHRWKKNHKIQNVMIFLNLLKIAEGFHYAFLIFSMSWQELNRSKCHRSCHYVETGFPVTHIYYKLSESLNLLFNPTPQPYTGWYFYPPRRTFPNIYTIAQAEGLRCSICEPNLILARYIYMKKKRFFSER